MRIFNQKEKILKLISLLFVLVYFVPYLLERQHVVPILQAGNLVGCWNIIPSIILISLINLTQAVNFIIRAGANTMKMLPITMTKLLSISMHGEPIYNLHPLPLIALLNYLFTKIPKKIYIQKIRFRQVLMVKKMQRTFGSI